MAKADAVSKKVASLTEVMASKFSMDGENFFKTFKATVFKSLKRQVTNEEVAMMMLVCRQYELNPFVGQVFAFPAKNGAIVPVVGVDGFVTIAERNKDYDGFEMEWSENVIQIDKDAKPCPDWCEIKIYRKNQSHPTVVREYLDEVYVSIANKGGFIGPWQTHPKRMLRHKTIVQGNRVAFAITGIYDEDEAHRIDASVTEIKTKPSFVPAEEIKAIDAPAVVETDTKPKEEPPKQKVDPKDLCTQKQAMEIADLVLTFQNQVEISNNISKDYGVDTYSELTAKQAEEVKKLLLEKYKKENKK